MQPDSERIIAIYAELQNTHRQKLVELVQAGAKPHALRSLVDAMCQMECSVNEMGETFMGHAIPGRLMMARSMTEQSLMNEEMLAALGKVLEIASKLRESQELEMEQAEAKSSAPIAIPFYAIERDGKTEYLTRKELENAASSRTDSIQD